MLMRTHKYEGEPNGTCTVQVPDSLTGYTTTVRCNHTKEEHQLDEKK